MDERTVLMKALGLGAPAEFHLKGQDGYTVVVMPMFVQW